MTSTYLNWNFKGSSASSRHLKIKLPCTVTELRNQLKIVSGINSTSFLDILLSYEVDPQKVLADKEIISDKASILIQRVRAEEAIQIMKQANLEAEIKKSIDLPFNDVQDHNLITTNSDNQEQFNTSNEQSNNPIENDINYQNELDDEDRRINAMMAQHAEHRGPSDITSKNEGLGQRYYRNKNLKWSSDTQQYNTSSYNTFFNTQKTRNNKFSTNSTNVTSKVLDIPISNDYICHLCGEKGHHIKNCHKSNSTRNYKKIKPAKGIPNNFLIKIPQEDISKHNEVYLMKGGQFAIMKNVESVSGQAFFSKSMDQRAQNYLGGSHVTKPTATAEDYKCRLCSKLFTFPVATPCCGETFCQNCILSSHSVHHKSNNQLHIIQYTCPACGNAIDKLELTPNKAIQLAVDSILKGDQISERSLDTKRKNNYQRNIFYKANTNLEHNNSKKRINHIPTTSTSTASVNTNTF